VSFYAASNAMTGSKFLTAWNNAPAVIEDLLNPGISGAYQRYAFRINFGNNTIDPNGFFRINSNVPASAYLAFACVSVEIGDTISGWSPAPLDSFNKINSANASTYISTASIGSAFIADAAITNATIQNGAIDSAKIGDAVITTAKIGTAQIDTLRIAGNSVTVAAAASGTGTQTVYLNASQGGLLTIIAQVDQAANNNSGNQLNIYINGGLSEIVQGNQSVIGSVTINNDSGESYDVFAWTQAIRVRAWAVAAGTTSVTFESTQGRFFTSIALLTQR